MHNIKYLWMGWVSMMSGYNKAQIIHIKGEVSDMIQYDTI